MIKTADICAMPVIDLAARDCILFLWATHPKLPDALDVMASWGFTFKTVAFTWVKLNPSGIGHHFGLGYWTRQNPELVLLGTRGKPKRINKCVPNLFRHPVSDHSRKPTEIRDLIVKLVGDLPRIELFARRPAPGWDSWGNEVDSAPGAAAVLGQPIRPDPPAPVDVSNFWTNGHSQD